MSNSSIGTDSPSSASTSSCPLQECTVVCPSNLTSFQETLNSCSGGDDGDSTTNAVGTKTITLKFLVGTFGAWIEESAKEFNQLRDDVNVEILVVSMSELSPNIINEATSKTGLFDGFVTPPGVMGSIVEEDGWADLRSYIESTANSRRDWVDIFLSYRKWISQYQNKILMYPLDGDLLSLYYREDILQAFGLQVPRTWEEYNDVAAATHGKVFNNQTLTGSCIGRVLGCGGAYWANLILSSMTQTRGTWEGHLFDTADMTPLLGDAFEKMLELMQIQARFGPQNEFEECIDINVNSMNDGSCVLSYSWGNSFSTYLNTGTVFQKGEGRLGVAVTPGSTMVLDRKTMKLVPCTRELCRFATYYEDIGWVNRAPYLAFGGWSCAVNNYTTPGKKILATEFCSFASSKTISNERIAGNASTAGGGSDPFRVSQLDVDLWTSNGYDRDSVINYFDGIYEALESDNVVVDIRFPTSSEIYNELDRAVHDFLNTTINGGAFLPNASLARARKEIGDDLKEKFQQIIFEYNSQASTKNSALEQYQKLRNVFTVNEEMNQLGSGIRAYGFSVASVTMVIAVFFAAWSYKYRTTSVVKASQPFFLILICLGVFVLASSVFPMAIDDSFASTEACDKACMAVPWLVTMGWSILFAALYAKLRRVNLVISNAKAFRSIKVSETDVMLPFAVLFTLNMILMTLWTVLDPLVWTRVQTSPTESYGACKNEYPDDASWKVIVSFIAIFNGAALIGANIEAYKARNVDTEYGESSYIGLIMGSFLQVVMVGLPLFFLVNDNPTARFFLTSSMVFLMSISVLLLLFLPKWRSLRLKRTKQAGSTSHDDGRPSQLEAESTGYGQQSYPVSTSEEQDLFPVQFRYNDYVWRERVRILEDALEEDGIDAKPYLKKANILDERDQVVAVSARASFTGLSVPADFIGRSSIDSSLAPVSEVEKESKLSMIAPERYPAQLEDEEDKQHGSNEGGAIEAGRGVGVKE